jgi:hypothetical protein
MPLAFSSLEITPVKGLLQLADRHILATDQWLTLDNVVLDQAGAVRKRDGYGALPRNVTVGGAAQPGAGPHPIFAQAPATGLWARGNELVALDTDASGTYVDSWSPARATWVRQDEACEVAQTVGVASSLYGIQTYTQTKLIRDYSMARSARVHACLQGDSVASLNKVYVRAVDDATGDVMIADSLAAQLIFRLLRFTPTPGLNEYCGLVSWNIGDTFYAKVDPFTGTIGTPVGFTGPPTSTTIVDATDLGDTRFATATWNPGTTGIDVNLYDTATGAPVFVALATLLLTPGNTVEDVSIHGIAGLGIVVAWREIFAGLDGHIRSVLLSDTTLATVWGPTTVTTGSTVHVSGRSWVSVAVSNAEAAVTWNEGTLPLLLSIDSLAFARID